MRPVCGRSRLSARPAAHELGAALACRRTVVQRAAVAGAVVLGGAMLGAQPAGAAAPEPSRSQDRAIFNFALLLEYLQAAFYGQAAAHGKLRGELKEFAQTVAGHEQAHVRFLRKALGRHARREPSFHFGRATSVEQEFLDAAVLLENIGVAAYNGQVANLTKKSLAAAVQIVSVEGRHAAWVSDLAGREPAPRAADPGASAPQVLAALRNTGFVTLR
jgi:rubrerythrin